MRTSRSLGAFRLNPMHGLVVEEAGAASTTPKVPKLFDHKAVFDSAALNHSAHLRLAAFRARQYFRRRYCVYLR